MEQKSRGSSLTVITSVSISKEFFDIIDKHNLSPTEIFRKGMGITLSELGFSEYDSELNRDRKQRIETFIEYTRMKEKANQIFSLSSQLKEILE